MVRGEEPTARGPRYHARSVRNDPPPIQARLPILIGGDGEKKTLHTVAYADAWNTHGDVEFVRHKDAVLRRWCKTVGRDQAEIERTLGLGLVVIRDDRAATRQAERSSGSTTPVTTRSGASGRRLKSPSRCGPMSTWAFGTFSSMVLRSTRKRSSVSWARSNRCSNRSRPHPPPRNTTALGTADWMTRARLTTRASLPTEISGSGRSTSGSR